MSDGDYLDDPNREAVGLEPAWAEGSGGSDTSGGGGPPPEDTPARKGRRGRGKSDTDEDENGEG